MKYSALITAITNEVRETRSWPDNAAGTKLAEQLSYSFGAVLAIGRELPLDHLPGLTSNNGTGHNFGDDISETTLPSDIFSIRPDKGIIAINLDGNRFTLSQATPWPALQESATNHFQAGNPLFTPALEEGKIYFCHTDTTFSVDYKPMFTEPTSGNYASEDVPLPEPYIKQAVELVAMHIEAVKTGNRSKSAVHQALSEYLSGGSNA